MSLLGNKVHPHVAVHDFFLNLKIKKNVNGVSLLGNKVHPYVAVHDFFSNLKKNVNGVSLLGNKVHHVHHVAVHDFF